MNKTDKKKIILAYNRTFVKYGDDPRSVHWSNSDSQIIRFGALTEIADLKKAKILDLGCGKGDLYRFLLKNGFRGDYTGVDINSKLISFAIQRYKKARFKMKDIEADGLKEKFDYVLISGIFNNRISDNKSFVRSLTRKAFALAKKGLAFNLTSDYVNFKGSRIFNYSPEKILEFCKTKLSRYVALRHDYLPFDFTVYVYKKKVKKHGYKV
jgi:SAM-dependent methyltransferase